MSAEPSRKRGSERARQQIVGEGNFARLRNRLACEQAFGQEPTYLTLAVGTFVCRT